MTVSTTGRLAGLVLTGALALSACGTDTQDPAAAGAAVTPSASGAATTCAPGTLRGAGSSFQKNIVAQWIKDFAAACSGANVDYQGVGSGAGIKQFTSGTVDFAGSDAVMKDEEQAEADRRCGSPALHLPLTAGGVAVTYNLDGVRDLQLSPKTLAGIFQGSITRWDDPALKADNPGASLPSQGITAVRRGDSSGTTAIFTGFLEATAKGDWKLGSGKEVDWPSTVRGAAKSDGVTQAVKGVKGAVTYVETSFASSAGLPVAKVQNSSGEFAALTAATVTATLDTVGIPGGSDLKLDFDYAALGAGTYPLAGVTYEIVCSKGTGAALPVLKAFLAYSATTGQAAAEGLDYAPLPAALAAKVTATVANLS